MGKHKGLHIEKFNKSHVKPFPTPQFPKVHERGKAIAQSKPYLEALKAIPKQMFFSCSGI